jgi:hypothetical protein
MSEQDIIEKQKIIIDNYINTNKRLAIGNVVQRQSVAKQLLEIITDNPDLDKYLSDKLDVPIYLIQRYRIEVDRMLMELYPDDAPTIEALEQMKINNLQQDGGYRRRKTNRRKNRKTKRRNTKRRRSHTKKR